MIYSTLCSTAGANSQNPNPKWQLQEQWKLPTLCFPFILHVSTSACLDFHVSFWRGQERNQLEPRGGFIGF